MNVTDFQEIWQVDVGGQIYDATFEVLTQWIGEGSLLPQDKVRRGNLRWIEARRVPALVPFFNAKDAGAPPPVVTSTVAGPATVPETPVTNFAPSFTAQAEPQVAAPVTVHDPYRTTVEDPESYHTNVIVDAVVIEEPTYTEPVPATTHVVQSPVTAAELPAAEVPSMCSMHPSSPAFFVCDTCANVFCKLCPKSYGGTVRICPFCGAMCQRIEQRRAQAEEVQKIAVAMGEGFGFSDFGRALSYPFRFKTSLLIGAIMFTIFTLGQSASSFGGMFMFSAAMTCYMLANMLYFGILTNVLENFSQGFTDRNFMPSFDDFSLWDDVVHPFFLSIGVYIVSFGLLFVVVFGSIFYVVKSTPSLPEPDPAAEFLKEGDSSIESQNQLFEDGDMPSDEKMERSFQNQGDREGEQFQRLQKLIAEQRKKQLESGIGKTPETIEKERSEFFSKLMKMALPILLLTVVAFFWGIFYWPAACLVAGYTRSFAATLNPKIGLETIRILGIDYFKILVFGFMIGFISLVVGAVLAVIFAPFAMPAIGNLPATAIGAIVSFYLSVVFSVVLGYALFKNADKLQLYRA